MMQALDLTRGIDPRLDNALLAAPDIPEFGENHAFWLFDDQGRYSLLCAHLETVPGCWQLRREVGALAIGDDRIVAFQGEGPATSDKGPGGATLSFECAEPFRRWRGTFHGTGRDSSSTELAAGPLIHGPRALVQLEFEAEMVAPPWLLGAVKGDAQLSGEAKDFIGGWRYEQLLVADVTLRIGAESHRFQATGLRTHRAGPRKLSDMLGHSWQTAVFPSGRAFGLQRYPTADGGTAFSEGWLLDGEIEEVRVVSSPWLTTLKTRDEPFVVELERSDGTRETIHGRAGHSMIMALESDLAWIRQGFHPDARLVIAQSTAEFEWNGEHAYGLLERSALVANVT